MTQTNSALPPCPSDTLGQVLLAALLCPAWVRGEPFLQYQGRLGAPLALHGPPGIGKTAQVRQAAADLELPFVELPIESCETEDLNGLVVRSPQGHLERLSDNAALQEMIEGGEGVLLLDEINSNRGLSAAINRLLYDGLWCRKQLPPGIRLVATLNPPHLSAGGRTLPASQANRVCHVEVGPHTREEWVQFLRSTEKRVLPLGDQDPRALLCERWASTRAQVLASLSGYLQSKPALPQSTPAEGSAALHLAWPSERTWHLALNLVTTCQCLGVSSSAETLLLAGCVGEAAAAAWELARAQVKLPSLQDVLSGVWQIQHQQAEPDLLHGVACMLLNADTHTTPEGARTWADSTVRFIEQAITSGDKDIAFPLLKHLRERHGLGRLSYTGVWPDLSARTLKASATYPVGTY